LNVSGRQCREDDAGRADLNDNEGLTTMSRIKLYRPSNGTEGDSFMSAWCERCRKGWKDGGCAIVGLTMALDMDDPNYPREWRYVDDKPTCTAFVDRDTPRAPRAHKPSVDQQDLFDTRDQGIDWNRPLIVADMIEEAGDGDKAEKIRRMVEAGDLKAVELTK
jgi:hypothetical protein